jgi:chromate transporter
LAAWLSKAPPKRLAHGAVVREGASSIVLLLQVLGFFGFAGSFVFGSGLAIVPFLHGGVVLERDWLTERQFLDAVAVVIFTPGPA